MIFANASASFLLLFLPLAMALMGLGFVIRKRRRTLFVHPRRWAVTIPSWSGTRRFWKQVLWLVALLMVIIAVLRPQFGLTYETVVRKGQDVYVLVDVSKSMNTRDVAPNRLAHAKQEILSLIENLKGDRIGLIVFAGDAFVQCPLTSDYGAIRLLLDDIAVGSVPVLGTDIATAIKTARVAMEEQSKRRRKLVLLFSDGENFENDPVESAKIAGKSEIKIYTIGLGTPNGEPVPEYSQEGQFVGFKKGPDQKVVLSKIDEKLLKNVAQVTGGSYYYSGSSQLISDQLYKDVSDAEGESIEEQLREHKKDQYALFLILAFLLLLCEFLVSERKREKPDA